MPELSRIDGRGAAQLRPVTFETGYQKTAEGSVLITAGNTRVLCAATVEETIPSFLRNTGKGWITAEYSMLPRATNTRTQREVSKGRASGRTHEIQRLIGRSLRAAFNLAALGERSIIVDCDVLQADGGTRTASITGAYVAVALAVGTLVQYKQIPAHPILDSVAAVSVGMVEGRPLLDLCYEEDSRADVDLNLVMTGRGRFVEVQGTSERQPFSEGDLAAMLALGHQGIAALTALQTEALTRDAAA